MSVFDQAVSGLPQHVSGLNFMDLGDAPALCLPASPHSCSTTPRLVPEASPDLPALSQKSLLFDDLRSLRLDTELADVHFSLDDGTRVPAHRMVLAMRSPYFRKMLYGGFSEAAAEDVKISQVRGVIFRAILEWVYTGELDEFVGSIPADPQDGAVAALCEVLEASNMFGMAPLEELCNAELIVRLNTATACYILNFARPDSPLKASALGFVASHRHELSSLETLSNKVRWGVGPSPFNLHLSHSGSDFAVVGMHFKLGLYEHQSAGALEGALTALVNNPDFVAGGLDSVENINILCYEPAFGIIGDPAKMNPTTRQSADHSMAHIVSRILLKGLKSGKAPSTMDAAWKEYMLSPYDYGADALTDKDTRTLMSKITFEHGGAEYDAKYPDGIPTSIDITVKGGKKIESGFVMYPSGHARNTSADLKGILDHKNHLLGDITFADRATVDGFVGRLQDMKNLPAADMATIYDFDFAGMRQHDCIDG